MRLLMFEGSRGPQPGVLHDGRVVDLLELVHSSGAEPSGDLVTFIERGSEELLRVRDALSRIGSHGTGSDLVHELNSVRLLAPLDPPRGNVVAIGRNYTEHAQESARARNEEVGDPTVFTKAQTSITGPFDNITVDPGISEQVDWEVELGVVIGRTGKDIAEKDALDHVFGYTVVNDISARDLQRSWGGQFFKGKSLDGFCPIGPWIVTADEIPDPQNLRLCLRVNGDTKQDANTRDMIFGVSELIARLSRGMTLPAGTLIATGTPAGVGMARNPPEYLRPGDVVEAEVEHIGAIRNRIQAASE